MAYSQPNRNIRPGVTRAMAISNKTAIETRPQVQTQAGDMQQQNARVGTRNSALTPFEDMQKMHILSVVSDRDYKSKITYIIPNPDGYPFVNNTWSCELQCACNRCRYQMWLGGKSRGNFMP